MIRPLRRRHRMAVCALGVLLPLGFVAGVVGRKPLPGAATVPTGFASQGSRFGRVVWTNADLWPRQRIITTLRRDAAGAVAVELMFRDLVKPDVLLYWATGKEIKAEGLPDDARLIGSLENRKPLPIPADVRGEAGRFVLYSLAHHEVVAASSAFIIQKH